MIYKINLTIEIKLHDSNAAKHQLIHQPSHSVGQTWVEAKKKDQKTPTHISSFLFECKIYCLFLCFCQRFNIILLWFLVPSNQKFSGGILNK